MSKADLSNWHESNSDDEIDYTKIQRNEDVLKDIDVNSLPFNEEDNDGEISTPDELAQQGANTIDKELC
jgi:hypothetical protein